MKKHLSLIISGAIFLIFIIFTILVKTVDVQYVSYGNMYLGFYGLNMQFGNWAVEFGKYDFMRKCSDVLLYVSFGYVALMAFIGVFQLVKKKSFKLVDRNLYVLLGGYIIAVAFYLIFEIVKINYAPDTSEGLKPSYPSSHILLGCSFYLFSSMTLLKMLNPEKSWLKDIVYFATTLICVLLVFTRALSTKHWLTDIIASVILVSSLIPLFIYLQNRLVPEVEKQEQEKPSNE